jgi:WhiB family redox-sensing transcriptional regulator
VSDAEPMPVEWAWRELAACVGTPIDWWFPQPPTGGRPRLDEAPPEPSMAPLEALALCEECPVRSECLEWALRHERHGVWAGTTERARARMRGALRIHIVELDHADDVATVADLADQGTPPPAIAEQLGMNRRTVYRHLDTAGRGAPATDHRRRPRSTSA